MKRVLPPDSFLATLARAGQEKYCELLNFDASYLTSIEGVFNESQVIRTRSGLHAYDVDVQTIVSLYVIRITCMSR